MAETWVINESPTLPMPSSHVSFQIDGIDYDVIDSPRGSGLTEWYYIEIYSQASPSTTVKFIYYSDGRGWVNQAYRTVTFETSPTGNLLTWLQANAVKQEPAPTAKTYLKTSNTYVNKINGQKIKKIIAGSTIYNIAGVKYINKLKAPKNLTADGTTIEFDEVENAEKYEVFAGGVSIGEFEPQQGETWLINEYPTTDIDNDCYFVSNEQIVTHINSSYDSQIGGATLIYTINGIATEVCDTRRVWTNIAYRTVYFPEPPMGDLLTWLQANAVKQ